MQSCFVNCLFLKNKWPWFQKLCDQSGVGTNFADILMLDFFVSFSAEKR